MKKMKFWNWTTRKEEPSERVLLISGVIAEESWLDDQVSPQQFKEELEKVKVILLFGLIVQAVIVLQPHKFTICCCPIKEL